MILFCFGLIEAVTMTLSFIGMWINDYIIPCVCCVRWYWWPGWKKIPKINTSASRKSTWNQSSRDASWQQRSTCSHSSYLSPHLLIGLVPQTHQRKSKCINRTKQEWITVLKWLWWCLLRIIRFCVLWCANSESDDIQTSLKMFMLLPCNRVFLCPFTSFFSFPGISVICERSPRKL